MSRFLHGPALSLSLTLAKYRDWNPFIAYTHCPELAQQAVLRDILLQQAGRTFGRKHRFGSLRRYQEFSSRVPVYTYKNLLHAVEVQEKNGSRFLPPSSLSSLRKLA